MHADHVVLCCAAAAAQRDAPRAHARAAAATAGAAEPTVELDARNGLALGLSTTLGSSPSAARVRSDCGGGASSPPLPPL